MREQHLFCVNDCKHVPLTSHLMPQAFSLKLSTETQVPKISSSFLKLRPFNETTTLLRSRDPLLLHEKLEPHHPLASVFQPHTPVVSEVFLFRERHIKLQTLLSPGCIAEPSAFLC